MTGRVFRLLREVEIPERGTLACSYVHDPTGLEVLALRNGDPDKCFGIAFRTETPDDTGVAHVLEHAVLCGSRRYPSAAPFAELLKGSLQSHLNAATLPDMTVYKAASCNRRDFYNLFEVYLDAVFHPLLRESTFRREGWHIEPGGDGRSARFGGVVFNEMKGVYADPSARLERKLRAALFQDTFYRFDHDGDPAEIPALTLEAMRAYHARYYHSGNALVFLSGDLDITEALAFLHERLAGLGRGSRPVPPRLQPLRGPQLVRSSFPAPDGATGHAMRGWILPPTGDPLETLEQDYVADLLIGSRAAPLRKALAECGLGGRVTGTGLSREARQPVLSIGIAGLGLKDAERFDGIIDAAMAETVRNGPERALAEVTLHRLEFRLRENDGGRMPPALALMHRLLPFWRAGHDPLDFLAFEKPLALLKERVSDTDHLGERIRALVADNLHRATVILEPDPEQASRELAAEQARLEALLPVWSPSAGEKRVAVSSVPVLDLAEIGRKGKETPLEVVREANPRVLLSPLKTNGICYLQIGMPLNHLSQSLLPLAPLFGRMLLEGGSRGRTAEAFALRRERLLGSASVETRTAARLEDPQVWLFLRLAGMQENLREILALVTDLLIAPRLDDRARFAALLRDEIARHQSQLVQRGHDNADLALSAALHEAGALAEMLQGCSQLQYLRHLRGRVEAQWESVRTELEQLREALVRRTGMICGLTLGPEAADAGVAAVLESLGHLPEGAALQPARERPKLRSSLGMAVTASVNFVALGTRLPEQERTGAFGAAIRHVAGEWLWNQVRMEGGAYGVLARFDPLSGGLRFLSYRDPHLLRTLDVFTAVPEFLRRPVSETEIRQGIIGAVGEVDRPKLPRDASFDALLAHLAGDTPGRRQARREGLLSATRADFLRLADLIEAQPKRVAVLGSDTTLRTALEERPGLFILRRAE